MSVVTRSFAFGQIWHTRSHHGCEWQQATDFKGRLSYVEAVEDIGFLRWFKAHQFVNRNWLSRTTCGKVVDCGRYHSFLFKAFQTNIVKRLRVVLSKGQTVWPRLSETTCGWPPHTFHVIMHLTKSLPTPTDAHTHTHTLCPKSFRASVLDSGSKINVFTDTELVTELQALAEMLYTSYWWGVG